MIAGCDSPTVSPPEPIKKEIKLAWGDKPEWTAAVLESVEGSKLKTATLRGSFSRVKDADKVEFFAQLVSIIAKYESGFKPENKYKESFKTASGESVISRGLLQLSIDSANQKAYACGFKDAAELHDPVKNLKCGVKILEHWILKDGKVIGGSQFNTGCARYWSVCRTSSKSNAAIVKYMTDLEIVK